MHSRVDAAAIFAGVWARRGQLAKVFWATFVRFGFPRSIEIASSLVLGLAVRFIHRLPLSGVVTLTGILRIEPEHAAKTFACAFSVARALRVLRAGRAVVAEGEFCVVETVIALAVVAEDRFTQPRGGESEKTRLTATPAAVRVRLIAVLAIVLAVGRRRRVAREPRA